jgi:uncharacterized protein
MPAIHAWRDNNPDERRRFEQVCDQLSGFNERLGPEYVDGWLTAMAAAGRELPPEEWLPALADDTFDRAFGDPPARKAALAALGTRLSVLRDQLDPEALAADPGVLALAPFVMVWEGGEHTTGMDWADGFLDGVDALPAMWPLDDVRAEAVSRGGAYALLTDAALESLDRIHILCAAEDDVDRQAAIALRWGDTAPTRDELIDDACLAVQTLRSWQAERILAVAPRRVAKAPGRNEPCHCGSGRKYKHCHGKG